MYINTEKMISDVDELGMLKERKHIFFDLDATVIGTVFTNSEPKECMRLYKKSVTDNRYSILRPGIRKLLEELKCKINYPLAMITDAKYKRAFTILTQFDLISYFDFIVSRECLDTLEERKGISRFCKPMDIFNGAFLFDDRPEAYEYNRKKCLLVPPFRVRYDEDNNLEACADGMHWIKYSDEFIREETELVSHWINDILI